LKAKHLLSELKLRPPKESRRTDLKVGHYEGKADRRARKIAGAGRGRGLSVLGFCADAPFPSFVLRFSPMDNSDGVAIGIGELYLSAGHVGREADWRDFDAIGHEVLTQGG